MQTSDFDFDLPPEHVLLRDTIRDFMLNEVEPHVDEYEKARRFPREIVARLGQMGWLGIPMNIPYALVSAMAVDIGADYAIYLCFRLREELRTGHNEAEAERIAFLKSAHPEVRYAVEVAANTPSALADACHKPVLSHNWRFVLDGSGSERFTRS